MHMKNPFYYGGSVENEHFCNRVQEIKELKADISAGLNTLIYAPRRFGKTSFVLKTMRELKEQRATCKFNQAAKPISSKLNFLTF